MSLDTLKQKTEQLIEKAKVCNWFETSFIANGYFPTVCKDKALMTYVPDLDIRGTTNFNSTFSGCSSLETIGNLDLSDGTDFSSFCYNCSSLKTVGKLKTNSGVNFTGMFESCTELTEIGELNTTSATTLRSVFYACYSLETLPTLDLTNATDTEWMFSGCRELQKVKLVGSLNCDLDIHWSTKLTAESAKSIMLALTNFTDTENEYMYSLTFSSATWDMLNAEGSTAPTGETWFDYVINTLKWNA